MKASSDTIRAVQSFDDEYNGLPSPASRFIDGQWRNVCWHCGKPVLGPLTRYWCPYCERTADDDPRAKEQHAAEVCAGEYPDTEGAKEAIAEACKVPEKKRTSAQKELASLSASVAPKEEPIVKEEP